MSYAATHKRRFEVTRGKLPDGPGRCLEIGWEGHFDEALFAKGWTVHAANWRDDVPASEANFDAQQDWPHPSEHYDLVLMCEVIEHLDKDPMAAICEANRVLKPGGKLFITTPNICSARGVDAMLKGHAPYLFCTFHKGGKDRHAIEYDKHLMAAMLHSGGFSHRIHTDNVWSVPPTIPGHQDDRGDCLFVLGTKTGPVRCRKPSELYHE